MKKENAYCEVEDETTKEKSYFVDFSVSPDVLAYLRETSPESIGELTDNFRLFGYSKGFDKVIYEVIVDEERELLTFHAIEIITWS